jgi:hypothetical protein
MSSLEVPILMTPSEYHRITAIKRELKELSGL